jgi:hypothetical protein
MPIQAPAVVQSRLKRLDSETVHALFGSFDAEQEDMEKFKEYFVTNNFFERFTANFPLRIAVGNKGAGKSAVLRASLINNQQDPHCICVPLTASDLIAFGDKLPSDTLKAINYWKGIFAAEAAGQLLTSKLGSHLDGDLARALSNLPSFLGLLAKYVSSKTKGASDIAIKAGLDLNSITKIVFYIDDLDKGWDGRFEGLHFVNSILNACYDMSKRDNNIQFRLAIRWDLWDAISRINQDIDKIRQNAVFLRWTNHEIYVVAAMRVAKFFGFEFPYKMYLNEDRNQEEIARIFDPILVRTFQGAGKWDNTPTRRVILAMTRNRPRDLITLLTLAAEEACSKGRVQISSTDLQSIFPRYSEDRLNDLIVEYGTRMKGLEDLLLSFKPSKMTRRATDSFRYTNDRMTVHLKALIKEKPNKIKYSYESGGADYRRLLDFLYRIDFLQAYFNHNDGTIERVSFQDRQLAVSGIADFGYSWEVLPAYRWAIQPTKLLDVINSLE